MAIATVNDFLALDEGLGGDGPSLCLDVGHLYATGEGEPRDIIPQVAGRLAQVHLEDMRRGVHEHLVPGEGDVDFKSVRTALHNAGYSGPVCFELSRSSHLAPEAVRTCCEAWSNSG